MDSNDMKTILEIGETIAVEFERCGNGIESGMFLFESLWRRYIFRDIR